MAHRVNGLLKIKGRYYFNIRVPKNLTKFMGKEFIRESLWTSEIGEAVKRCRLRYSEIVELFRDGGPGKGDIDMSIQISSQMPVQPRRQTSRAVGRLRDITLRQLFDEFVAFKVGRHEQEGRGFGRNSVLQFETASEVFFSVVPASTRCSELTTADMYRFRDKLVGLPRNRSKIAQLARLPIDEAIVRAERLGLPTCHPKTLNCYLGSIQSCVRFGIGMGYPIRDASYKLMFRDNVNERDKRLPFTNEDVQRIINALPGQSVEFRLITIIALTTGARMEEICRLHIEDLVLPSGDDKPSMMELCKRQYAGKNTNAARRVPIHPILLESGIREYADVRKSGPAWPSLKLSKATGKYQTEFSKQFGRWLTNIGVKVDSLKTFHSFRHLWNDRRIECQLFPPLAVYMEGRAAKSLEEVYGGRPSADALVREMAKMVFPYDFRPIGGKDRRYEKSQIAGNVPILQNLEALFTIAATSNIEVLLRKLAE